MMWCFLDVIWQFSLLTLLGFLFFSSAQCNLEAFSWGSVRPCPDIDVIKYYQAHFFILFFREITLSQIFVDLFIYPFLPSMDCAVILGRRWCWFRGRVVSRRVSSYESFSERFPARFWSILSLMSKTMSWKTVGLMCLDICMRRNQSP